MSERERPHKTKFTPDTIAIFPTTPHNIHLNI